MAVIGMRSPLVRIGHKMIKSLFGNRPSIAPVALDAFISPNNYEATTSNGSYTTPFFTGSAIGGTAPYTYAWVISRGSVASPTNNKTTFTVSGNRTEVMATATLTVTDDVGAVVTETVSILIQFGNEIV